MFLNDRFDRLCFFIKESRLIRNEWGDGQERACLLVAIAPEVGENGDTDRCPAYVLPRWMAHLTPDIDDNGSMDAWPKMVERYATVVRRGSHTLDEKGWYRVLCRFMVFVIKDAEPHDASGSCESTLALWLRVLEGDEPTQDEWKVVSKVAVHAPGHAANAAAASIKGVLRAYNSEDGLVHGTAACTAATYAAESAKLHSHGSGDASAEAWDRMTEALFQAIETECDIKEGKDNGSK
jgi:hypothetical protein